jgi:arylsulfatase A-like enzyme/Tfp pilus assembly protein PilF
MNWFKRITRSFGGRLVLAACVSAAAAMLFFSVSSQPAINVLVITLDTTRADRLGCYRYAPAQTPALDQFAAEGILFERAYTPAPLTLAAHASLFTGLYPREHGLVTNGRGSLNPKTSTLAGLMTNAGYETGAFVASFVLDSKFGLDRGFKTYDDDLTGAEPEDEALHRQRAGAVVVESALNWLKAPRSSPFFCWVHLYDPHFPYLPHEDQFGDQFLERPYDAEIAYVDMQVKRLLDHIREAGLESRTLVVIVGDHGEGLGDHVERTHGNTLYESTQHVPLLIRTPGRNFAGHHHAAPVCLVDVFPTILDVVGLRNHDQISGRSLSAALQGKSREATPCYGATDEPFLQNGWSPLRSLTTDRWKYIRSTKPELYDLHADSAETRNMVASEVEQVSQMESQLAEMESRMSARNAESVQLSVEERRVMQSLGYLGGSAMDGARVPASSGLPDIKDMLPFEMATQDAVELLRAGDVPQAISDLRAIVASSPLHVASRIFLGEAFEHSGQIEAALSSYTDALSVKPDSVNALVHLGTAKTSLSRFAEAQAHFEEALRRDPDSTAARFNLGLVLARQGKLDEAVVQFQETLDMDEFSDHVRVALGNVLIELGRTGDAASCFEREIAVHPRTVEARINLAAIVAPQQPEEARRLLVDALKIDPRNPQGLYNLGALLLMQGRPQEAIAPLTEAARLMPDDPRAADELQRARRLIDQK